MNVHVVTYANKSYGMFDQLIKNDYNVNIEVLGWGTKWNGYIDKSKGVLKYIEHLPNDHIVVFVDGFDTRVIKDLSTIVQKFKSYNCKVLVSKDPTSLKFFAKINFGSCNKFIANAGMYMGYVQQLKTLLHDSINMKCKDDQRILNTLCKKYKYIKVDHKEKIFKNVGAIDKDPTYIDAIFLSYPGKLTLHRQLRMIMEYSQFWYMYILMFHLILYILFRRKGIIYSFIFVSVFIFIFTDISCII